MRFCISLAARRVKVIIITLRRGTPPRIMCATLCTIAAVFPVPAPASTTTCFSVERATSRWLGLSSTLKFLPLGSDMEPGRLRKSRGIGKTPMPPRKKNHEVVVPTGFEPVQQALRGL